MSDSTDSEPSEQEDWSPAFLALVIAAFLLGSSLCDFYRLHTALSWPKSEAVVTSHRVSVREVHGKGPNNIQNVQSLEVTYLYSAGGQLRSGKTPILFPPYEQGYDQGQSLYPIGSTHQLYYDPKLARGSFFEVGPMHYLRYLCLIVGLPLLLYGLRLRTQKRSVLWPGLILAVISGGLGGLLFTETGNKFHADTVLSDSQDARGVAKSLKDIPTPADNEGAIRIKIGDTPENVVRLVGPLRGVSIATSGELTVRLGAIGSFVRNFRRSSPEEPFRMR